MAKLLASHISSNGSDKLGETIIEFDIEIKNKKGVENVAADHLSQLEKPNLKELREEEINDEFPNEFLLNISTDEKESPWFADFTNYLVWRNSEERINLRSPLRCIHGLETQNILNECHHGPTGGHYGPSITAKKVFDAGFYWPTIFKEAQIPVQNYDACQRSGSISRRDDMPLNNIQAVDKVLLYNSKYKFKAPKHRSKWYGPFIVKHGYPFGYLELCDKHEGSFIVNEHRVKLHHDEEQLNKLTTEKIHLMCEEGRMKAIPFMAPFLANYRETMPLASEKSYIYSVVENTCNEAKLYDLDKTGLTNSTLVTVGTTIFFSTTTGDSTEQSLLSDTLSLTKRASGDSLSSLGIYLLAFLDSVSQDLGSFIVNEHHVKLHHDEEQLNKLTTEKIHLMCEEGRMKAIPFMAPFLANYRETMPLASEKSYIYSVVENTCNEAKLYDLDETGKRIVINNILYVPSEGTSLEMK
nr:hypothetical protein [Tanacetum cinerariifolium]